MLYAGIGSRESPDNILDVMTQVAQALATLGYTLRSGGAEGADTAFEDGAGPKEIFRPKHATAEAIELASQFHPAWHNCSDYVRKLHGRNAQIILGRDLATPVEFAILWTSNEKVGGTSLGIRIANHNNIPVKNLFNNKILEWVKSTYL